MKQRGNERRSPHPRVDLRKSGKQRGYGRRVRKSAQGDEKTEVRSSRWEVRRNRGVKRELHEEG